MILRFSMKEREMEYIFDRSTNIYYVYLKSDRNKVGIGKSLEEASKNLEEL